MIYAYAICEAANAAPPPSVLGLGRTSLRALEREGIGAVYSRHRSLRVPPRTNLVLGHERVVEAIMARGPVLPLRYGTQLQDEEQLATALTERREELLRALDRVRGHVELGLRVILNRDRETDPQADTRSGRDYLLARARDHRLRQTLAGELHAPLAELAAASVVREPATPPAILVASYLVDAKEVAAFRRRADDLAAGHENARILVTGPWPPYSFSAEEGR